MHWADVEAERLMDGPGPHRIATGITPSGHIHVGNMREIITGDAVLRALHDRGEEATLIYIADSFDPLRKRYSFLPESYEKYVGHVISQIPCPCRKHENYSEHFLEPFLASVNKLGIYPKVLRAHRMYQEGLYQDIIRKLIENKTRVREILERVTGQQLKKIWFPYSPICSKCRTISSVIVNDFVDPYVHYTCGCGYSGRADIRTDDGKLPWRLEWPARWSFLNVSCEPFGKDHASAGGSYETGKEIVEKILGSPAPHPVVYEWIQLKGKGAMSSSKGVVISGADMLKMTPPEVLRFLVMRVDPPKHIDFDPGFGLLNLIDEYDRHQLIYFGQLEQAKDIQEKRRIFELSQVSRDNLSTKTPPHLVSYKHLVSLVQIDDSPAKVLERLRRTEEMGEPTSFEIKKIFERMDCTKFWLNNFAPSNVKFTLQKDFLPEMVDGFGDLQRNILLELIEEFKDVAWKADEIHQACYNVKEKLEISPMKIFSLLYRLLLNQNRGPRLGYFLSTLSRDFIVGRLQEGLGFMNKAVLAHKCK